MSRTQERRRHEKAAQAGRAQAEADQRAGLIGSTPCPYNRRFHLKIGDWIHGYTLVRDYEDSHHKATRQRFEEEPQP